MRKKALAGTQIERAPEHPQIRCKGVCVGLTFSMYARECPRCGWFNPNFFQLPEQLRDAYVEFWHDREVWRTVHLRAIHEGITVEELYRKAAEFYLSAVSKEWTP